MGMVRKFVIPAAAALSPVILTYVCIAAFFHSSPADFHPVWNDEIDYWHQILTFVTAGFNGGYYSVEEAVARTPYSRFGTHGPFFSLLFGSAALLTGWSQSSALLFNMFCISAAAAFFLWRTRSTPGRSFLTGALLVTCWPLLLYIPSAMQESLHHALALVLAALFADLYRDDGSSPRAAAVTFIALTAASLLRATWAALFIPFLLQVLPGRSVASRLLACVSGLLCLVLSLFLFAYLAAPFPDNFVNTLFVIVKSDTREGLAFFLSHAATNLKSVFLLNNGYPLEILQHYQMIVFLAGSTAALITARKMGTLSHGSFIHVINLGIIAALVLTLYDTNDWRDYRVVTPHLLFSASLMIAAGSRRLPLFLIISSLLLVSGFSRTYRFFHREHFSASTASTRLFALQYAPHLRYRPEASPWENSLLVDIESVQPFIVALPGGIGINAVMDWQRIPYPLKSSYILVPPALVQSGVIRGDFSPLAAGPFGTLYKNLGAPVTHGPARPGGT